jgi:ABC-type sugar transport system substrate-binding protein
MTLTNLTQKVAGIKSTAVRALAVAAFAGAALAAAPAAQAQRVFVGFGGPHVVVAAPPVVFGYGYYGHPYWHEHFAPRPYWHR